MWRLSLANAFLYPHVAFERSAELERSEVDIPHVIADLLQTDIFTGATNGQVRRAAYFHCKIVSLAKVFDRNRKASSLCNYLRKEIHALSPLEADRLDDLLSPHNQVIDAVRRICHEFAAHTTAARTIEEIFQRAGVAPDQIQDLISAASEAINTLGRRLGWTNLIFTSDRAVRSTMSLLQDLKITAT